MCYLKDMWKDIHIFSFLCDLPSPSWRKTCQYRSMWMVAPRKVFLLVSQPFSADIFFLLDVSKWHNLQSMIKQHCWTNYPVICISIFIDGHPSSWMCSFFMIIPDDQLLYGIIFGNLTLSWRRLLSYRKQSIDYLRKSMDWFLYVNGFRHERAKLNTQFFFWSKILA